MVTKRENPNDEPDEIGKAHPVEHGADIERDDERGRGDPRSDADAADDGSTESSQEHAGFGRGEHPRKAKSRSR